MDNSRMREFTVGASHTTYPKNTIRNQRYKWYSFVFMVLRGQFQLFFNKYFLFICVTQVSQRYSVSPLISNVMPWAIVIGVTLFKEAVDDINRYKRDRRVNSEVFSVLKKVHVSESVAQESVKQHTPYVIERSEEVDTYNCSVTSKCAPIVVRHSLQDKPCAELYVGDIILIEKNMRVPADCILLAASEPNVFIRTDQLDGETDWKLRVPILSEFSGDSLLERDLRIIADVPHKDIYSFVGQLIEAPNDIYPVVLENTLWMNTVLASGRALCCVVYTGTDTRATMNTLKPKFKVGLIDKELNFYSMFLCCLSVSAAVIFTLLRRGSFYRFDATSIRFLVIFSSVIPISLKVSIDWARYVYTFFIQRDIECRVRNSTIPEELGRIGYLLTDKTGTLTCNVMKMKKVHLGNVCFTYESDSEVSKLLKKYLERTDEIKHEVHVKSNPDENPFIGIPENPVISLSENPFNGPENPFNGPENPVINRPEANNRPEEISKTMLGDVSTVVSNTQTTPHRHGVKRKKRDSSQKVFDLLVGLSVCHNVTPTCENGVRTYQASSPDEVAIVNWTDSVGMKLLHRDTDKIVLEDFSGLREFKTLHIFPFTSESKRMGIIVKNKDGEIDFYLKGADVVMNSIVQRNDWLVEETSNMAREGLRTLIIGKRRLCPSEYKEFSQLYNEAQCSMADRPEKIKNAISFLEKDLSIIGLTGVEDRLQDGVMVTLENLRNAGIRIWMLTGDKVETATCIAISSRLFTRTGSFKVIEGCKTSEEAWNHLIEIKSAFNDDGESNSCNYIIIDGVSIHTFMTHFKKNFIEMACRLDALVCCRCSPTQKAAITAALKLATKERIACIGDGGNDVSMITEAHVGIGIVGKEGMQASLASDFSLLKFSDVCDLFLWHGRNSYQGTARLAYLIIHRGTIISVMQAIFCSLLGFAPFTLFQGTIIVLYVTLYTLLPFFASILSYDINKETAFKFPELYKEMNQKRALSLRSFATWNVVSFYQGSLIILLSLCLFQKELSSIICITFSSLIINELMMVAFAVENVTNHMLIAIFVSLIFYVITFFILPNELVLPCHFKWFVLKLLMINSAAIIFTIVQMVWNRFIKPSSALKLSSN